MRQRTVNEVWPASQPIDATAITLPADDWPNGEEPLPLGGEFGSGAGGEKKSAPEGAVFKT